MPYKLNDILFSDYGIEPGRVPGEGIAIKGIFDMPKRIGDISHSWAESNSVEPYVDEDEIFLGGRTITFHGIMVGDKATNKANLDNLKTAIDAFTDLVPLETPYGNACVYVKKITPILHSQGAAVLIEFVEPTVGAACGVDTGETIYYSAEYSETAEKNDCPSGYHGSTVQLTSVQGRFTSTVSQAAADLLAVNWVRENKQLYANTQGTCIIDPPSWWNDTMSGQLQKDNCYPGYIGSIVTYEVPAFTYQSFISKADANAKAQNEIDTVLTQEYANEHGTCEFELVSTITMTYNEVTGSGTQEGYRTQRFNIGPNVKVGSIFKLTCYGVELTYTAQAGDTSDIVAAALVNLINGTTTFQWNALFMAPHGSTFYYPPTATHLPINRFEIVLNWQNQFYATVDNDV